METRQTVLIVAPSAYKLGGVATWLDYLMPGLQAKGWKVLLGLVAGPRYHNARDYLGSHPWPSCVEIYCQDGTSQSRIRAIQGAIKNYQPDVVLTVNIPSAILAASQVRTARRPKVVMTCHGIQEDLFADMHHLHGCLDAVVCTNKLACRLAERIGQIVPKRSFHAAYGTFVPDLVPPRPENEVFTIAYSGRLEQPQKRVHDLLPIAQNLNDHGIKIRFIIAGDGPERLKLESSIRNAGLTDSFQWLGFIAPDQLQESVYGASDALIVTSSWETGPIVIWEAMAAGLPVITSKYIGCGQESLLENRRNCLMFDIGDTEAAASNIGELASNSTLQKTLSESAFQFARKCLSHQPSIDAWDEVLRSISELQPLTTTVIPPAPSQEQSRLNSLLGSRIAGILRRTLKRFPRDSGPGGEWPHAMVGSQMDESDFWELASMLDHE